MAEKKKDDEELRAPHPSDPSGDPAPVGPIPSAMTVDATLTAQTRQFQSDQSVLHAMASPPEQAVAAAKLVDDRTLEREAGAQKAAEKRAADTEKVLAVQKAEAKKADAEAKKAEKVEK